MRPVTPDFDSILDLVGTCLSGLREDLNLPPLDRVRADTPVFGEGSDLDSMGVVHLISDLEGRLYDRFGLAWILADERALSRTRSPFRTVGDLADFIMETQPKA